jgi:hypothetical protein
MSKGNLYNLEYISSQVISGGHITTGYDATTNYDVVNKAYFDAHGSVPSDLNVTTISSSKISGGTLLINTLTLDANIISGLIDPPYPSAAATKHYVDTYGAGALSGPMVGTIGANYDFGISGLAYISSQVISGGNYLGNLYYPISYVIYGDGTNYTTKNCQNGQIVYAGTSPMTAIQTALDSSGSGNTVKLLCDIPNLDGGISGTRGASLDLGMHHIQPGSQFEGGVGSNKCMFNMIANFFVMNGFINVDNLTSFKDNDVFRFGRYPRPGFSNATYSTITNIQNIRIRGKSRPTAGTDGSFATCSGTAVHLLAGDSQAISCVSVDNLTADFMEYVIQIQCNNDGALGYINGNRFNNIWATYCSNIFWISCNSAPTTSTSAAGSNRFENFQVQMGSCTHKGIYCNGNDNYFNGYFYDDYCASSETGLPAYGPNDALYEFFSGNKSGTGVEYLGIGNYVNVAGIRIGDPHVYVHDAQREARLFENIFIEWDGGTGRDNNIRTSAIYTDNITCTGSVYNSIYLYLTTGYLAFRNLAKSTTLSITDIDSGTDTYINAGLTNLWVTNGNDNRIKLTAGTDTLMYVPKGRSLRMMGNWSSSDYGIGLYAITSQDSVIDGGTTTKDCLTIKANSADTYPFIYMSGSSGLGINNYNTSGFSLSVGTTGISTTSISSAVTSGGIVKLSHISSTTWDITMAQLKNLTDTTNADTLHTHTGGAAGGFPSGTTGSIQYRSGSSHAGGERLLWDMTNNNMIISGGISLSGGRVGIGTMNPSTQLHCVSGISFGVRTLTPQALLTIELTDNDQCPNAYQAVKMQANRNGANTIYGFNGTAIGANTRNVGLYSYADEATTNYGLWVDAGQTRFDDRVGIGIQPEDSQADGFLLYVATGGVYAKSLSSQAISANTILCSTFNVNASIISGLVDPIYPSAAVNMHYVDTISGNLNSKIGGGSLSGPMLGNIGANYNYEISGLKSLDTAVLSCSGNSVLSGAIVFRRTSTPVIDIRRYSAYTNNLIDGPKLSKHQAAGSTAAAGTGISFVFSADNASGTETRIGVFGGTLANATAGSEVGELIFSVTSGGIDVASPWRHVTLRGAPVAGGDNTWYKAYLGVHDGLQIGCDLNIRYPTNALEVSGSVLIYSGNSYLTHGYYSGQHMTPISRGAGKPAASEANEGVIYRTSGTSTNKSYVWICLRNSAGTFEWVQLGISS